MRNLSCFALSFLAVVACGSSAQDDDKRGVLGRLELTYATSYCVLDCAPRIAIATGARVTLLAKGDDPEARYHGRLSTAGLTVESEGLRCTCREEDENGASSEGTIAPHEACYAPEVKRCSRVFTMRANAPGPVTLELLGPTDELVDRVTLVVATPARLEPVVKTVRPTGGTIRTVMAAPDGAFDVDAPTQVEPSAKVFDADGAELHVEDGDVLFESPETKLRTGAFTKVLAPGLLHVTAVGLGMKVPFTVRVGEARPR